MTPWVLLGLLFVIGVGGAASAPTWQTLQPELAPPEDRTQAIALGSVNQNLARASARRSEVSLCRPELGIVSRGLPTAAVGTAYRAIATATG